MHEQLTQSERRRMDTMVRRKRRLPSDALAVINASRERRGVQVTTLYQHWTPIGRPLDAHWTPIGRPLDAYYLQRKVGDAQSRRFTLSNLFNGSLTIPCK